MLLILNQEALDLVASKMQETITKHGKDSVSMYGSGQWTIPDGYVASKFMKGCIGFKVYYTCDTSAAYKGPYTPILHSSIIGGCPVDIYNLQHA